MWSKLNKGILPSSLRRAPRPRRSTARINYQPWRRDISCCFPPLSRGATGPMLLVALQRGELMLLDRVTRGGDGGGGMEVVRTAGEDDLRADDQSSRSF